MRAVLVPVPAGHLAQSWLGGALLPSQSPTKSRLWRFGLRRCFRAFETAITQPLQGYRLLLTAGLLVLKKVAIYISLRPLAEGSDVRL